MQEQKSTLFDIQFLFHIVQVDGQQTTDSLFLHGDAVEDVGLLHGAPAVGNDDELGLGAHAPEIPGEPGDVDVVQGGLDLVHDAEGGGPHLQNGEVEGDGHEGLLAAGEERKDL